MVLQLFLKDLYKIKQIIIIFAKTKFNVMIIAIDFDGTIVSHRYPEIGNEIPFATTTIRKLIEEQHQVILWTVRRGKLLQDAVDWCKER